MCQQGHAEANWPNGKPPEKAAYLAEPLQAELVALRAENERLREALRDACPDCVTPEQAGTRNGYTCPKHRELAIDSLAAARAALSNT